MLVLLLEKYHQHNLTFFSLQTFNIFFKSKRTCKSYILYDNLMFHLNTYFFCFSVVRIFGIDR